MILSHSLKLIFIKTRKVGGTSFEIALSKFCGDADIVTPVSPEDEEARARAGIPGPRNHLETGRVGRGVRGHPNCRIAGDFYNHMPARAVCRQVGRRIFDRYTKITIHRDPLDFLVSQYFWRMRAVPEDERVPFGRWLSVNRMNALKNYRTAPVSGRYASDVVLRYDALEQDIAACAALPEALFEVFSAIRAKGGTRRAASRDAPAFFRAEGAGSAIEEIRRMVERERRGGLQPRALIRRLYPARPAE